MTSLTELLGRGVGGVYRVSPDVEPSAIEEAASAAGWRFVHLDTATVPDKAAALAAIAAAFEFPTWFGHNFDALVDSLRDLDHRPGTLLLWDNADALAAGDTEAFDQIVSILRSRSLSDGQALLVTLLRRAAPDA